MNKIHIGVLKMAFMSQTPICKRAESIVFSKEILFFLWEHPNDIKFSLCMLIEQRDTFMLFAIALLRFLLHFFHNIDPEG